MFFYLETLLQTMLFQKKLENTYPCLLATMLITKTQSEEIC